jgi:hypothetical protein
MQRQNGPQRKGTAKRMTGCSLYLVQIPLSHIVFSNAAEYSSLSETNLYIKHASF